MPMVDDTLDPDGLMPMVDDTLDPNNPRVRGLKREFVVRPDGVAVFTGRVESRWSPEEMAEILRELAPARLAGTR